MSGDITSSREGSSSGGSSVEAFERFRALVADPEHAFTEPPETYLDALDGFLLNPRYRPHVELIMQAVFAATLMNSPLGRFYPAAVRKRLMRQQSARMLAQIDRRRADLIETVVPAEVTIDFPPLRAAESPPEWSSQGLRVLLLEVRVAVHPNPGLEPASVLLKVDVSPGSQELHFLASFPETDFSAVGKYDIELAADGRFVQTSSSGATLSGGISHGPVKATGSLSESGTVKADRGESAKVQFEYTARATKVVSSAVGQTARWQLMRTEDQLPIGGLTFYATVLVPKLLGRLEVAAETIVDVDKWGPLKVLHRAMLVIPKADATRSRAGQP